MNKINYIIFTFISLFGGSSCTDKNLLDDDYLPSKAFMSSFQDKIKDPNFFKESGTQNGHGYVDLGLSVMWATCNVGASSIEGYGDYFAWGETMPKDVYSDETYSKSIESKYGNYEETLDLEDDAAHANWGGNWRMPTKAEQEELRNNCTWVSHTQKGVKGYIISSNNGNSIFLPAGYFINGSEKDGSYSNYWSSTSRDNNIFAYCLFFSSYRADVQSHLRKNGCPVRAVLSTIRITAPQSEVTIGEALQLSASFTISDETNKAVIWSTSDATIATVSSTGLVTAIKAGRVTITATAQDGSEKKGTYTILVKSPILSNGHEYVDLGLSVLWATVNIGATSPEDYGDCFAWGETLPKDTYTWGSYFDPNHSKYDVNKLTLDPEDDVAHVKWGGNWRMPTYAEQGELLKYCTWTWTTHNGVNGYEVASKKNGKSIFLPAAGYGTDGGVTRPGDRGNYWSSNSKADDNAYLLYFNSEDRYSASATRVRGYSVRAVLTGN